MIVGIAGDIKCHEYRVGLTRQGVKEVSSRRHDLARTINSATLPHAFAIANYGWCQASRPNASLSAALNAWNRDISCEQAAVNLGLGSVPPRIP